MGVNNGRGGVQYCLHQHRSSAAAERCRLKLGGGFTALVEGTPGCFQQVQARVCGALGAGVNAEIVGACQLRPGHRDERHLDQHGRGFVTFRAGTACDEALNSVRAGGVS